MWGSRPSVFSLLAQGNGSSSWPLSLMLIAQRICKLGQCQGVATGLRGHRLSLGSCDPLDSHSSATGGLELPLQILSEATRPRAVFRSSQQPGTACWIPFWRANVWRWRVIPGERAAGCWFSLCPQTSPACSHPQSPVWRVRGSPVRGWGHQRSPVLWELGNRPLQSSLSNQGPACRLPKRLGM